MKIFFLTALAFAALTYAQGNECQVALKFLCANKEMALKCGVLDSCSRHHGSKAAQPVKLAVYFESYCPDSIRFLTTMLYPTYKQLNGTKIFDVLIVPYGKAHTFENPDGSYRFICQHGKNECIGNTIENCLLHYTSFNPDLYLPVVQCMETAKDPVSAAEQCVKNAGLNWNTIDTCTQGAEGNKLTYQAGVVTQRQNLNWVPWIVVNGVHNVEIQNAATTDLLKLICSTYEGEPPKECN